MNRLSTDILILGAGGAGLFAALHAKKAAPGTLDSKEVICNREPVLGSLFPKEVCASREARAERTREDHL